jgi:deoxyadenosine/deoxycytidine kinase
MSKTVTQKSGEEKGLVVIVDGEIGVGKSTLLDMLAKCLGEHMRVCVIPEPVDQWRKVGALDRFYKDPQGYAYTFQTYTFVTRVKSVIEAVKACPDANIYLLERSILTDRHIFMECQRKSVGEQTMQMYEEWCDLWQELMPLDLSTATYVYLKPNLKICMNRVEQRGRDEELGAKVAAAKAATKAAAAKVVAKVATEAKAAAKTETGKGGVSLEYQENLRRAHEALFQGMHVQEFPAQSRRPFPLEAVLVLEGAIVDGDFTPSGKDHRELISRICARLSEHIGRDLAAPQTPALAAEAETPDAMSEAKFSPTSALVPTALAQVPTAPAQSSGKTWHGDWPEGPEDLYAMGVWDADHLPMIAPEPPKDIISGSPIAIR